MKLFLWPVAVLVVATGAVGWYQMRNGLAETITLPTTIFVLFLMFLIATVLLAAGRQSRKLERLVRDSRLSEARARKIARVGYWEWDIEADRLTCSDETCRIFGLEPAQSGIGRRAFLQAVHAGDRGPLEDALRLAVTDNLPYSLQHRIVLPDGRLRYVHAQGEAECPDSGRAKRLFGTVQDISERYLAGQEELARLSGALQQVGEIIVITDSKGVIEYVNPAFTRITGYTADEAIGKKPSILKSDLQEPAFYREMWETISRGNVWKGTLTDRRKDGSYFPVMITVSPVKNDQQLITHYISVQQDISGHQQLEEQLHHSQKMEALSTLVGGIAHDFNNMLAGILGNTYLIRARWRKGEDFSDLLDAIDRYGNGSAEMVRQMLTFACNDNVELKPVDMTRLMHESCRMAGAAIPGNIACSFRIDEDALKVLGDVSQIRDILLHLTDNARDAVAAAENPGIEVSLQRFQADRDFCSRYPDSACEEYARLTVRDNGSGIRQEDIKRVFDPFFTTKGVRKGTGLGLSMVYGAVRRHNGIIDVESVPGEFTMFHIYLPLMEASSDMLRGIEVDATVEGGGATILLADDEEALRAVHASLLADLGFQVLQADSGLHAVELFREHRETIRLALLDIVMPQMSGVEAALRIQEITPGLPIVFVTGYDLNEALSSTRLPVNYQALQKPFTVSQLAGKIRLAMEGPPLLQSAGISE